MLSGLYHYPVLSSSAPCRPCSDTEVLLAICTSDFGKSVPVVVFPGSEGFPKSALISFMCVCVGGGVTEATEPGITLQSQGVVRCVYTKVSVHTMHACRQSWGLNSRCVSVFSLCTAARNLLGTLELFQFPVNFHKCSGNIVHRAVLCVSGLAPAQRSAYSSSRWLGF